MASLTATAVARPILFALAWRERLFADRRQADPVRRARELCALPTQKAPRTPLLWLHGVDIGEAQVALRLAQDLWQKRVHLRILLTTVSRAAATLVENNAEPRLQHQYAPLDRRGWWRRFLNHWQPLLAIRCENEFWPNSIIETATHCPLLFVQARMSEKSFRRWQSISRISLVEPSSITQRTMNNITLALCQDEASAHFLHTLGVQKTQVTGNLKSLPAPCTIDQNSEAWFAKNLLHKKFWIAASTHPTEEAIVIEAHHKLCAKHGDALCVIAPRHLTRIDAIAQRLTRDGDTFQLRSHHPSCFDTPFFLLDSFGELNSLYRWAKAVFVGGSLANKGGHNLFEPARHACRILHGPHMQNTHAPLLQRLRLTQEVTNADDLAAQLLRHFDQNAAQERFEETTKKAARQAVERHHHALRASVLQSLEPYMKRFDSA